MILIFGGTTEGRLAVDVCEQAGKTFYYSTKSNLQDVEMHHGVRLSGAMSSDDIIQFCNSHNIKCIVDAAHPFAENLHQAIADTGIKTIRLLRVFHKHRDGVIYCSNFDDAVTRMSAENIHTLLALSGANTISKLASYWQHHRTIFRILQRQESIDVALRSHFPTSNLIFYPADHSLPTKDEERNLMQKLGCDAIITKESGASGGFEAKVDAAIELGLKVFVVNAPMPSDKATVVTGEKGLRRSIEEIVPDFFPLKTGFTTGACATAATKAALLTLLHDERPREVSFSLPDGEIMSIPIVDSGRNSATEGWCVVKKDTNDDPDVTKGCKITSLVNIRNDDKIVFLQGKGVGTVTLPGLGIPVGEPAINPTPRRMIELEIRALTHKGVSVTISVEDGAEIAKKTFNPKVGVIGGISIIGTSGIVSPLSNEAFIQAIRREMEVAKAIGCKEIALVSGKKAEDFLHADSKIRCIHYGNFIGESLKAANELGFAKVVLAIMIGKAVKLAEGHLDTHSHKVQMNREFLKSLYLSCSEKAKSAFPFNSWDSLIMARELWQVMPQEFFDLIIEKCYNNCKNIFTTGELKIRLIRDENN